MLIAGGALAVAGLVVGLVVLARPAPAPPSAPAPPPASAPDHTPPPPVATAPPRTSPQAAPPPAPLPDAGEVRDHRGEPPGQLPTRVHSAETLGDVLRTVTPAVAQCATGLPAGFDGPVSILVNLTLRTTAGRLRAEEVTVDGAAGLGAAYATCVAQAVGALDQPATPGQADGADLVHLPFRVP
jgi:hypothetical protein